MQKKFIVTLFLLLNLSIIHSNEWSIGFPGGMKNPNTTNCLVTVAAMVLGYYDNYDEKTHLRITSYGNLIRFYYG